MPSSDDSGGHSERSVLPRLWARVATTHGADVPPQPGLEVRSAKERQEVIENLAKSAEKITADTLKTLEQSSKSTLLFAAALLGFLMTAAPYLLVMVSGADAITTVQYLTTSLSGGVLAMAGLVGLVAANRSTQNTASEVQERGIDKLEAARKKADMDYALAIGQGQIPAKHKEPE